MSAFIYEFDWDSEKAKVNFRKHGVPFERATQVFRDPLALSIPDEEHSETEARWIPLGKDAAGQYVLVVHTFEQLNHESGRVRLISARPPTRAEVHTYEEDQ
jgi:hypothetical protein